MIIKPQDLPTLGQDCSTESVNIRPLSFIELFNYVNNEELDPISKLIRDIDLLTAMDSKINDLSMLDLPFIDYMMKALTISSELKFNYEYRCSCCNEMRSATISSQDLEFKNILIEYLKVKCIEVGGIKFNYHPTSIADFRNLLTKLSKYHYKDDIKLIKLACLFRSEEGDLNTDLDIFNALVHEDLKLVVMLMKIYFDLIEPIKLSCSNGPGSDVALGDVTSDLFRLLLQSNSINPDQIYFK